MNDKNISCDLMGDQKNFLAFSQKDNLLDMKFFFLNTVSQIFSIKSHRVDKLLKTSHDVSDNV